MVFSREFGKIFGRFGKNDLRLGVDAMLEGVEAGCGFSRGGAGSCGDF